MYCQFRHDNKEAFKLGQLHFDHPQYVHHLKQKEILQNYKIKKRAAWIGKRSKY